MALVALPCLASDLMTYESTKTTITSAILLLVILTYMIILNIPLVADDYYWFSPSVTRDCWTYFFRDMLPNDPDAVFLRPLPIHVPESVN